MKILTWNIRWGGENRTDKILSSLREHNADIVVLTEYRPNASGQAISEGLNAAGWRFQTASDVPSRQLGVFIGSKIPLRNSAPLMPATAEPYRLHRTEFSEVSLIGAYLPYDKSGRGIWDAFVTHAKSLVDGPTLIVGDFNTGVKGLDFEEGSLVFEGHFEQLLDSGYVDLWRRLYPEGREYTWYSNSGNGFRLDHALANNQVAQRVAGVAYSHVEREQGVSDHSVMLVELG